MSLKYCQGPKCHTYDTTDRKRGPKGNKRNQTRTISTYSYGKGNFCTLGCQDDWWAEHGLRAVDHFGRIHAPIILTEDNAWRKTWNNDYSYGGDDTVPRFVETNMYTRATRPYSED